MQCTFFHAVSHDISAGLVRQPSLGSLHAVVIVDTEDQALKEEPSFELFLVL